MHLLAAVFLYGFVALSAFWLLAWSSVWGQGCRAGTSLGQGRDGVVHLCCTSSILHCNKGLRS